MICKKSKIKRALESNTPANSMYSLIPANRRKAFRCFAACFGFTEEKIKRILTDEKR